MTARELRLAADRGSLDDIFVPDDVVFDEEGAAAFLHVSVETLRRRNVPRAALTDEEGKRAPVRYLKSQLVLYVLQRTRPLLRIMQVAS